MNFILVQRLKNFIAFVADDKDKMTQNDYDVPLVTPYSTGTTTLSTETNKSVTQLNSSVVRPSVL
jgi:hypothetical protein